MNTLQEKRPVAERAVDYAAPEVNIFENKDGYVLEAEMPGVSKEGLEITLEGNELTLVGRRQVEAAPGEPLFRESAARDYRRGVLLRPATGTAQATAAKHTGGVY